MRVQVPSVTPFNENQKIMTINPNKKCSQEVCTNPSYARGWCNTHYERARLPDGSIGDTTFDLEVRCLLCESVTGTYKRFCKPCRDTVPREERNKKYKAWHRNQNLDFYVERSRKRNKAVTPEESRFYNLKYNYGLSFEDFKQLQESQSNCCAICEIPEENTLTKRLHIDHDHETGMVRGLLCMSCNTRLGHLRDSIENLRKALSYLERTKNNETDGLLRNN